MVPPIAPALVMMYRTWPGLSLSSPGLSGSAGHARGAAEKTCIPNGSVVHPPALPAGYRGDPRVVLPSAARKRQQVSARGDEVGLGDLDRGLDPPLDSGSNGTQVSTLQP
jgi:hypothetical protein